MVIKTIVLVSAYNTLSNKDDIIEKDWVIHQLENTANFSPRIKWLSWYIGGLNFQIELKNLGLLIKNFSYGHDLGTSIVYLQYLAEVILLLCISSFLANSARQYLIIIFGITIIIPKLATLIIKLI